MKTIKLKPKPPALKGKRLIIRVNGLDLSDMFLNKGIAFRIKLNKYNSRLKNA